MPVFKQYSEFRGTVELFFDDRTSLRIRKKDFEKLKLSEGDEIDLDQYSGRACALQLAEGYEAALSLLDYSARTEEEIRKKLSMKGYLPSVIDAILDRLRDARLVNDKELAKRITESSAAQRMGTYALKRKLRARGVSEEDAEEAVSEMDPEIQLDGAVREAERLVRKYASLPSREKYAKLSQALARRGFSWDAVSHAVDTLRQTDHDEFDEF